jgi:type III pantothenate kinase
MLLALNVGTTNTTLGLFREERLLVTLQTPTQRDWGVEQHGQVLRSPLDQVGVAAAELQGVAVACVVPALVPVLREAIDRSLGQAARLVGDDLWPRMPVRYDPPAALGADRLVNALAAVRRYGAPAVVIDWGTATTFEVVSRQGEFVGGLILPGVGISLDALLERAPQLPRVPVARPRGLVGSSTLESLQSGVYYGAVAQVEGLARRLRRRLGAGTTVIATGGLAPLLASATKSIDRLDPHLTLEGLRLAWLERDYDR